MAKFQIHGSNGASVVIEGNYTVTGSNVLVVRPDKGNPFIMSPSGWTQVDILDSNTENLLGRQS